MPSGHYEVRNGKRVLVPDAQQRTFSGRSFMQAAPAPAPAPRPKVPFKPVAQMHGYVSPNASNPAYHAPGTVPGARSMADKGYGANAGYVGPPAWTPPPGSLAARPQGYVTPQSDMTQAQLAARLAAARDPNIAAMLGDIPTGAPGSQWDTPRVGMTEAQVAAQLAAARDPRVAQMLGAGVAPSQPIRPITAPIAGYARNGKPIRRRP